MPSRKENNFALSYFKFYFSPCFKTCLTCSSPAIDACNTCVDPNAILQNGKCVCNTGYEREPYHPLYPCVPVTNMKIVVSGSVINTAMQQSTIFYNNIENSSRYCKNYRAIVGGGVKLYYTTNMNPLTDTNTDVYINLITYNLDISYYKVRVTVDLITEEDFTLGFPFEIFSSDETKVKIYNQKQIKYLKFSDAGSTIPFNCYEGQTAEYYYKHYSLIFYIDTNDKLFYLKIQNDFNKFWGILTLTYDFYNCHKNCADCFGYSRFDCISCKSGMVLNKENFNPQKQTSSCICDEDNGFVKTSVDYSPELTCTRGRASPVSFFFINDLDAERFNPFIWKTNSRVLNSNDDIQYCEYNRILGNYNPQKFGYYERKIDLIKNLPNFDFFQLDFSFNVYFFKKIANYIVKVYLDNNYIYGSQNLATAVDETIVCSESATFYRKLVNFTYFNSDYFQASMNKNSPTLRIQVIPDSECYFNSDCGWGLNNLKIQVNRVDPRTNSTCAYRPYVSCPCAPLSSACTCFPGYYNFKASWGDHSCLRKESIILYNIN